MNIISVLGSAAVALTTGFSPPVGGEGRDGGTPDLVLAAATDSVVADFDVVEYYPNLKSKLGFASNIRRTDMADAGRYIDELGPGLMCSNIEFDYWRKSTGEGYPALNQTYETQGDPTSRPTVLADTPGTWLTRYQSMLGALNVSQLYQLTGAPAQFNTSQASVNIHPAPSDLAAAAELIAAWTASDKHPFPVLWSLWNEPGHTLLDLGAGLDPGASAAPVTGKAADRKAARQEAKAAKKRSDGAGSAGKAAAAADRTNSANEIAAIFKAYSTQMRPLMGRWAQFGLASFISADFDATRGQEAGKVYFAAAMDALDPAQKVDFLTFNSFNGGWPVILNGVRAVSGAQPDLGPVIFTQYAPKSLKVNPDGSATKKSNLATSPMQVTLDMVDDFVQMQRATDVQSICMSYWIGSENGFLDSRDSGLVPTQRYAAMKLLASLPVVRTRLDFGASGLDATTVHGLAGRNQGKVAVLLWNESKSAVSVPLILQNLPPAIKAGAATLTRLDDATLSPATSAYDGGPISLPALGMVLVEVKAADIEDPLLRRNSVGTDGVKTRFLQTLSFTDRLAATCKTGLSLPGVSGCARNSGTYGFYDSVRSVAYLGMGSGKTAAKVTATYSSLPAQLFVNSAIFAVGADAPATALKVVASFTWCDSVIEAAVPTAAQPFGTLDLQSVPADCRAQSATLTMTLAGVPVGTQAEVYLSANQPEAQSLASSPAVPARSDAPDMTEGLVVNTKAE